MRNIMKTDKKIKIFLVCLTVGWIVFSVWSSFYPTYSGSETIFHIDVFLATACSVSIVWVLYFLIKFIIVHRKLSSEKKTKKETRGYVENFLAFIKVWLTLLLLLFGAYLFKSPEKPKKKEYRYLPLYTTWKDMKGWDRSGWKYEKSTEKFIILSREK